MGQAQAPQRGGARGLGIDQHFLVNRAVVAALLDAAGPRAESVVAELGAGRGTVAAWMPPVAHLDLIELDPALCRVLRERFATRADVRVRCEDAIAVLSRECASYDVMLSNLPASLTPQVLDLLASSMEGARSGCLNVIASTSTIGISVAADNTSTIGISPAADSSSSSGNSPTAANALPNSRPRTAIVAAPASLDLSPWEHSLDISPVAMAEGDDFDPPQPFATRFVRVARRCA